jgi:hypothetical protein
VRGFLQETAGDSIILISDGANTSRRQQPAVQKTAKIGLPDVSYLSLPRKSNVVKGIAYGLVPLALGAIAGAGADEHGFPVSPKAIIYGLSFLSGLAIGSIGGSVAALKGVDIDIPLEGKSEIQKRAILSQVVARQYRSRPFFKVSPWAGVISPPQGNAAAVFGGRLRYYFTQRSGLELAYGRTDWFSREPPYHGSYTSRIQRSKMSYFSGGFFIFPIRKRSVTPFVAWGWGKTSAKTNSKTRWSSTSGEYDEWEDNYTDTNYSVHFSGGVEIPLTSYLSLEGRLENIWSLGEGQYGNIQLALNFGPNF